MRTLAEPPLSQPKRPAVRAFTSFHVSVRLVVHLSDEHSDGMDGVSDLLQFAVYILHHVLPAK